MDVLAFLVGMQAAARLAVMGIQEKSKQSLVMAICLFASMLVFANAANAAWRGEFPRIADLTELFIGDAVEVTCFDDEGHPDYQMQAWPPGWLRWEAQVLSEDSPGVYTLGAFPDLMAGKESFEEFWATIGNDLLLSTELPYVELKDFLQDWPNIPEEDAGHITMTYADGLWSFSSKTMIGRSGICGSCSFSNITSDEMDMTWSPAADRFEGIATVTGKPGCCLQRSWQPYYCEVGQVRCQDYCAYLAEYDGRWEEQINLWRIAIENWGFTPTQVEQFFGWQLAALEAHTTTNACPGAGDEGVTPRLIGAQCEILQELIEFNRNSPSRLAVFVPQYQRLECPCKGDITPANGLPDYFDYADPATECPDIAMVTETLAHPEYMIPVPEPASWLMLASGLVALGGLAKLRGEDSDG